MGTTTSEDSESRRIILLRGKNPEVLLGFDGPYRNLPEVEIPLWHRPAEHLTAALGATCGIDAVSLSSLGAFPAKSGSPQIRYEIMEPTGHHQESPCGKEWLGAKTLVASAFRIPQDFHAVRQAVAQSVTSSEEAPRGPFACLGWIHELEQWSARRNRTPWASSQRPLPSAQCLSHVQLDSL